MNDMNFHDKIATIEAAYEMYNRDENNPEVREVIRYLEDHNFDKLHSEYKFFCGLHVQSKYDNVISMKKIAQRLGVKLDIDIDLRNIDYDAMWERIGEQMPMSWDIYHTVRDLYE